MALRSLDPLKSVKFLRRSRTFRQNTMKKSDIPKILRLDSLDDSLESEETEQVSNIAPQIILLEKNSIKRIDMKKKEQIKEWGRDLKKNDILLTVISILGLILGIIHYEDNYSQRADKDRNVSSDAGNILKLSIALSTLYLIPLLFRHSVLTYKIDRENEFCFETYIPVYWKSAHFKKLFVELLINLVVPVPFLDLELEFEQLSGKLIMSLDAILVSIMMLRTYNIFRALKYYTQWNSEKAQSHCKFHGCKTSELFVLKCLLNDMPYVILVFLLCFSVVVFGVAIRIYERPYTEYNDSESQDYDNIYNAMWVIIMSMTTVGYGDFFPRTHIGRILGVLACFWGVFLISMTVLTLTNSIEFNKNQLRSFLHLKRYDSREHAVEESRLIAKYTLMINYYKLSGNTDMVIETKNVLFDHLRKFKNYMHQSRNANMTEEDLLHAINDKINANITTLKERICQANELYLQVIAFQDSQVETRSLLADVIETGRDLNEYVCSHSSDSKFN